MLNTLDSSPATAYPEIIQGGMGAGVSNWRLANAVAKRGQLGVVSGTALDTILLRRLQLGDPGGHMRRALKAFPYPEMVQSVMDKWYIEGGKQADEAYKLKPMPTVDMLREDEELLIVANFAEVYLAKEGHSGMVGINLLEKIQLPTLPSLFGAMLADVDVVCMGGGIPLGIPGALDKMAQLQPVEMKLHVMDADRSQEYTSSFHPGTHVSAVQQPLKRPLFFAVISSDVLAKTLMKKASGKVDGFVIENFRAGGHNAPPRRGGEYTERDVCSIEKVAALGMPFWLAGGCATPTALAEAKAAGACGVQVGTAFACCQESGVTEKIKAEIIQQHREGRLEVITDFKASPTGYPFKRVEVEANSTRDACRACDLGYLRHVYAKDDGSLSYRCPASPRKPFLNKGGTAAEAEGKQCLCNGLLATIGMGTVRRGTPVQPLVTWGEDMSFLDPILGSDKNTYSANDVIDYILSPVLA
ncbi:nitronate monooxygenase [Coraliomargarita sp. SDUM461003]|uniref:Nitronate monooxygenase n=1 Tax=Thalassobacterium maritimum TaxID=3041265 RepID=A0ABU1APR6_9BACT|nr:nitronate monooxygenase [Coraliomargarita sp. SDUM461003]MDQ8206140.1 nitronate monooxygenase [Coraliomargarita sp. SDUM461003]